MTRRNNRKMKWSAGFVALVLAVAIPVLGVAEATQATAPATEATTTTPADGTSSATTTQPMGRGNGNGLGGNGNGLGGNGNGLGGYGSGLGGYGLDVSGLTDEQKTAYDSAVALYEQVEDQVLQDLVTAGAVTQADVDAYATLRTNRASLCELDQSGWTADQYKAFYEANQKTGDERTASLQALVTAGQLTQAQADALSAVGQDDLWSKISQNASTNSAIESAFETMRQARQTLTSTLNTAGIESMGKGGMFGGFGMGEDFGRGRNGSSQNGNSGMRGGQGGRR